MPDATTERIEILVLDDHAVFRESIARLLSGEPDFGPIAHCGSIDDALAVCRLRHIDLVLLDLDLGRQDGLDFLRAARQQGVDAKVLIVTAGVDRLKAAELIRSGISGFFLKRHSAAVLVRTIREVMSGRVSFDEAFFRHAMADGPGRRDVSPTHFTSRERQVLSHVFDGLASKEIAAQIGVSESSVKATLQQLFAKTGVRTRSQLVRVALERYKNELG